MRKIGILLLLTLFSLPVGMTAFASEESARELVRQRRYLEAAGVYESLVRDATTFAEEERLRLDLANVYFLQQDYPRALREYRILIEHPDFSGSPRQMMVLQRLANLLFLTGRYEDAAALYQDVVDYYRQRDEDGVASRNVDPSYRAALQELASVQQHLSNYDAAKETLRELIRISDDRDKPRLIEQMIRLYEFEAVSEEEMRDLLTELTPGPRLAFAYYQLADIYTRRGFIAEAVDLHKRVLDLGPEQYTRGADALFGAFEEAERLPELADLLRERADAQPERTIYARLLFEAQSLAGDEDEAIADLRRRANQTNNMRLKEELARFLLNLHEFEDAEAIIHELLVQSPGNTSYLDLLSAVYRDQGKIQEAVQIWRRRLAERPTEQGYLSLARLLRGEGMTREAIEVLQEARGPNLDPSRFYHELILMHFETGQARQAVDTLVRLLLSRPAESRLAQMAARNAVNDLSSHAEAMEAVADAMRRVQVRQNPAVRTTLLDFYLDMATDSKLYDRAAEFLTGGALPENERDIRLYNFGRQLLQVQEYEAAIRVLDAVRTSSHLVGDARYLLGMGYLTKGDLDGARRVFAGFVPSATETPVLPQRDPVLEVSALLQLASIAIQQHRPGDALRYLREVEGMPGAGSYLRLGRGLVDLYYGHAYAQLGSLDEALQSYGTAREENGEEPTEADLHYAHVLLWQGKGDEAREIFRRLAFEAPDKAVANEAMARRAALLELGGDALAYYTNGLLYEWQGRHDEAVEQFRELSLLMDGTDASAWALYEIAQVYEAEGEIEAAQREYEKILERTDHPVLLGLAQLAIADQLAGLDDLPGKVAEQAYEQVILSSPDSIYAAIARQKLRGEMDAVPY